MKVKSKNMKTMTLILVFVTSMTIAQDSVSATAVQSNYIWDNLIWTTYLGNAT